MEQNPYQTPQANVAVEAIPGSAEDLRNTYLKHEASVRSIGILYYLAAIGLLFGGIVALFTSFNSDIDAMGIGLVLFILFLGIVHLWIAVGLRKLKEKVKVTAAFFSFLGLLNFPIGTLLHTYILYLLLSKKGHMVFSNEYQAAIEATPHIKYRTSIIVWLFLALVILAVGGIAAAIIIPAISMIGV